MKKYKEILAKLDIVLNSDDKLIETAFVHRSYLNENRNYKQSNERLEFLGDSILSYLTSNYLYNKFPDVPEGELTNFRSSIVKTTTLAQVAKEIGLGDYLMLSKGEEDGGGRKNPSILADTFEALVGGLFLTSGLPPVEKLLNEKLFPHLTEILEEKAYKDAKSTFQEVVQEMTRNSPVYKVLDEKGPDHAKEFKIGVYVDSELYGTGSGKSKQEAETNAAAKALATWNKSKV